MISKEEIIQRFLESKESEQITLDNLDWAKLVFDLNTKELVVQNEHGTQFDIEELSEEERRIFYEHI